jgi:hypothetical protein
MPIRSAGWSKFFYRFSSRLVRDVGYPCFGIAMARYLADSEATLIDCLGDALILLIFVIATACIGFIFSWILSEK